MVENILRNMVALSCPRIVVLVISMLPIVFDHDHRPWIIKDFTASC